MEDEPLNYQQHLFYIDQITNQYVPYWFLEEVTRVESEEILKRSNGTVLMRKHSSYPDTGRYIISYRKDASTFRHYVVLNTPEGYKLDVDHKNNRPVNCLSEVMELFIRLTGRSAQVISRGQDSTIGYLRPVVLSSSANGRVEANKQSPSSSHGYVNVPSSSAFQQPPSSSHRPGYINVPNVMQSLNQPVPPNNEAEQTKPHSYINTPQGSISSHTKKTSHDYINIGSQQIKTHSYINDVKVFGQQ